MPESRSWPVGGGETGALIRDRDWSNTPIGPTEQWPQRLRWAVELMLAMPQPAAICWGPDARLLYNDEYSPILGARHSDALGRPAAEVWPELGDALQPALDATLAGQPQQVPDQELALAGRGEGARASWFTGTWTPLRDNEGRIGGFFCTAVETTERVLAMRALRESEERYRTLVQNIRDYAIFMLDPEGIVTEWTEGAERVKGYTAEEVIGRHVSICYTPEQIAEGVPERDLAETAREGRMEAEGWRVRKGGERFWSNEIATAIRDGEGRLVGFTKITRDLTEWRRATEALRESERRFRAMFEQSPIPKWIFDPRTLRFLEVNAAAVRQYGYSREEFLSRTLRDIRPPEELEKLDRALSRVSAGAVQLGGFKHSRRDGSLLDVEITTQQIEFKGQEAVLALAMDVTERNRATAEAERFKLLASLSNDAIFILDEEARIRWANQLARDRLGYTFDEFTRMTIGDINPQIPNESFGAYFERARRGRVQPFESVHRRKDGSTLPVEITPTVAETNEGAFMLATVRDITERKQAEAALGELNQSLENRVKARTAELERTNRVLEREIREHEQAQVARTQALRQLVYTEEEERQRISRELHDQLGQQLTGLLLGLRALESEAGASPRLQDLQRLADGIARDIQGMAVELRPPALDNLGLSAALQDHLEDWSRRYGIEADFHAAGFDGERLPQEMETTIYRVAQEGLNNAVKHARASRVSLVLERRREMVNLILEDDGVGFDVEETTLARPEKAQRLGLRGMRERVALLCGELEIESSPGSGTTIYVRIPGPPDTK